MLHLKIILKYKILLYPILINANKTKKLFNNLTKLTECTMYQNRYKRSQLFEALQRI